MAEDRPASLLHLHNFDLRGEDAGAFRHRVVNSMDLLANDGDLAPAEMSWLAPGAPQSALDADILVIHALAGIEIEALIRERRRQGRTTLFEIGDDLSAPRPWSRRQSGAPNAMLVAQQCLHASLADGVQVASQGLAEKYAALNARVERLDNAVTFPETVAARPPGFVFGWAGTRSHAADLAAIAPAIIAFCADHPDAIFALMGDAELSVTFSGLARAQYRWQPFSNYDDYRAFLGTLDIAIAPLSDGAFSRARSDVKPIEMAADGAAVLVQSAPAFARLPGAVPRFDDADELLSLLRQLHAEPAVIDTLATTARQALAADRAVDATRSRHSAWYRSWIRSRSGPLDVPRSDQAAWHLDAARQRARAGDRVAALAMVMDLLADAPDHAQARWLGVNLLAEMNRTGEALALGSPLAACPIHRHVWGPRARALGAPGMPASIIPSLCLPPVATDGDLDRHHRATLAAHPFHPFALAAEEHRLRRDARLAEADALRTRRDLLVHRP